MHLAALYLGLAGVAHAQSPLVDAYYAKESPIAKAGVLANIGNLGSKSSGAMPGIVIASPSSSNPDYLYTWTRDSAITLKALIDQYTSGQDTSLKAVIDNYVHAQAKLQFVSNPSGSVSNGGLGEPKFNIDETAFTGSWGRPQRDGPALRAIALVKYTNHLLSTGDKLYAANSIWPVIQRDLDYVTSTWNSPTFDLWEEVYSLSFFTTAVQHRSLRDGADLADRLGENSTPYRDQAENILHFLQSYWNSAGYITANTGGGRSGRDCNTLLASIHTFDPSAGCDATTFQPCSDKALSNLKVYVDAFRGIYTINSGISFDSGVATGRYPEDYYYGGNPWYITTLAVAELLYKALDVWNRQGSMTVTPTSLQFFSTFMRDINIGTYYAGSPTFTNMMKSIWTFSDSFVAVVAKYTPEAGGLSEQYSKYNGVPISAPDLTWSYVAMLTSSAARNAIATSSSMSDLTPSLSDSSLFANKNTVPFTFNEHAITKLGEQIYVVGSIADLANWSPDEAIALSAGNYPTWSVTVSLPVNTTFQYKYIRVYNGEATWESDPSRQATTPSFGSSAMNDSWR